MQSEFKLIEDIKKIIPRKLQGPLGIGDDAALLPKIPKNHEWLLTTDVLVDGVDFRINEMRPEMIGRKTLAVNLSDIAAMGGIPAAFVISLGIPAHVKENWIHRFYKGMIRLAKQTNTACVGGDISRASNFFASVALLGHVEKGRAVTRCGAKRGDLIFVTGKLGGSILKHHYDFTPRLSEAGFLNKHFRPTAMIDISDGLIQDLEHILKSSGVGARIDFTRVPISKNAEELVRGNADKALRHALTDGEDFELLFTVRKHWRGSLKKAWKKYFPKVPLSEIGIVTAGKGKVINAPRLSKKGFTHF
ncbi:MAG: thiamine-monophosphate kinase [Candidatus Omnitrophica bacterium]|nr:thiamine-monophosphate kinase [Candidatus Omnitrophota bacterium]